MPSIIKEAGETFVTLVKGFSVTFRNMLRKPVTENYLEKAFHFQPSYRGILVLHRDDKGL
jgi:formate hydrogenlyase subunit 6/NADH:ubiquinone oxidoreductase subunit I